ELPVPVLASATNRLRLRSGGEVGDAGQRAARPVEQRLVVPAVAGSVDVRRVPAVAGHRVPARLPVEVPEPAAVRYRLERVDDREEVGPLSGLRGRVAGGELR